MSATTVMIPSDLDKYNRIDKVLIQETISGGTNKYHEVIKPRFEDIHIKLYEQVLTESYCVWNINGVCTENICEIPIEHRSNIPTFKEVMDQMPSVTNTHHNMYLFVVPLNYQIGVIWMSRLKCAIVTKNVLIMS
jgi:hypothetical protein